MGSKNPQGRDPVRLEREVEQRTLALRTLEEITRCVNESESATQALANVLRILVERSGWEAGHAWLITADEHRAIVSSSEWHVAADADYGPLRAVSTASPPLSGEAGFFTDVLAAPKAVLREVVPEGFGDERAATLEQLGVRVVLGCAVRANQRPVALLEFFGRSPNRLEPYVRAILPDACIQLGHAIERQDLERRIAVSADHERRVLAQELHDSLGQQVAALGMIATTLARHLRDRGSPELENASRLMHGMHDVQRRLRALAKGLLPVQIEGDGLMRALRDLVATTDDAYPDVQLTFNCPEPVHLEDSFVATQLYRIAQEAMNNALRHSGAANVTIGLVGGDPLTMTVRDDGKGLPQPLSGVGSGLRIMRHRAGLVDGRLELESASDGGTTVRVRVPLGDSDEREKKGPGDAPGPSSE